MLEKINLLVDLLTRVPETPPGSHFQPSITSVPATLANDTVQVNTALPQNSPTVGQHENVHSPAVTLDIISQEELFAVRSKASSVRNFALQLIRALFNPEELQGTKKVRGVGGKQPLNPEKLQVIKNTICKYYPAPPDGRDSHWIECRIAVCNDRFRLFHFRSCTCM